MKITTILFILFLVTHVPGRETDAFYNNYSGEKNNFLDEDEQNNTVDKRNSANDTTFQIDNTLYYRSFLDSLRLSDTYLARDTISNDPELLFIEITSLVSPGDRIESKLTIYYNEKLTIEEKGIIIFCLSCNQNSQLNYYDFIDYKDLTAIIKMLNTNLAFDAQLYNFPLLPQDIIINTCFTKSTLVWIKAKDDKKELVNEFILTEDSFGFGPKLFGELMNFSYRRFDLYAGLLRFSSDINNEALSNLEQIIDQERNSELDFLSPIRLNEILKSRSLRTPKFFY